MNTADTLAGRKQRYAESIARRGENIVLRRAGASDVTVRARLLTPKVDDLTGSKQQMMRPMIVLAEDVVNSGFPLPFQCNKDRVIWNGSTLVLQSVDEATRRVAGVVIAYELMVAGA